MSSSWQACAGNEGIEIDNNHDNGLGGVDEQRVTRLGLRQALEVRKTPITAAEMNDRVLPFFEEHLFEVAWMMCATVWHGRSLRPAEPAYEDREVQ